MSEQEPRWALVGEGRSHGDVGVQTYDVSNGRYMFRLIDRELVSDLLLVLNALESRLAAALAAKEEAEQDARRWKGHHDTQVAWKREGRARLIAHHEGKLAVSEARAAALEAENARLQRIAWAAQNYLMQWTIPRTDEERDQQRRLINAGITVDVADAKLRDALTAIAAKTGSEDQAGQEDRG